MFFTKVTNLPGELWTQVEFAFPTIRKIYSISNLGRIKTTHRFSGDEALIFGSADLRGYLLLNVRLANGDIGHIYVHRFVAETYVKRKSKDAEFILHKDRNRRNNRSENLVWATKMEWKAHIKTLPSYQEGRRKVAERYKLDEERVKAIRERLKQQGVTLKVVAQEFGISVTQVYRIKANQNWRISS